MGLLGRLFTVVCVYIIMVVLYVFSLCVLVYGSSCLVECVILHRQPVKMLHLLSGDLYTSACAWGGGVSLLASGVLVYGSSCLVGCVILRRQPVKMLHLLTGDLYTSA